MERRWLEVWSKIGSIPDAIHADDPGSGIKVEAPAFVSDRFHNHQGLIQQRHGFIPPAGPGIDMREVCQRGYLGGGILHGSDELKGLIRLHDLIQLGME